VDGYAQGDLGTALTLIYFPADELLSRPADDHTVIL
jgi:hypothetical protein